jgi:hypothetical protein
MMMSLRQTLFAIGKQPPIRIPGDVTMHGNSLREFLNPYWKFKSVYSRW